MANKTFLKLCQDVARESGTISGTYPTAVTSQSGRLLDVVNWVNDAWRIIQNKRNAWAWMRKEFTGTLSNGTAKYTAASFSITDHARWVTERDSMTLYQQSTGVSDEGEIENISWASWRQKYGRGSQTNNKPTQYAVSPASELCFGAIPDDTYVVNGEYYETPQALIENADEPNLPERFEDVIRWGALMLMAGYDEDAVLLAKATANYGEIMRDLERDQLPQIGFGGGPIA